MRHLLLASAIALFGCGDDGGGGDPDTDAGPVADAAAGDDDAGGGAPDAGGGGGTQGPGQFCDTLPDGGPYCESDLECCDDKVCRLPDDCSGSEGYLPCTSGDSCPSSKICCEIPSMTFCTKQSACDDYGGTEIP